MSVWGKARLRAAPDNGGRRTLICEGKSLSLPAAMFHPIQGAPAVVADNGGPLVCTCIIAMQVAVQFGTRAQRGLLSTFGGTAASPPLVVVEL